MRARAWLGVIAASVVWTSLALATTAPAKAAAPKSLPAATQGRFSLLTYNVAGLPEFISQSDPVRNIPLISGLLNLYDVALVQEDFAYHAQLSSRALHPYRSEPVIANEHNGMGDGLNLFSRVPFSAIERVTWKSCNGLFSDYSDCLTTKGFTVSVHHLAPGVELDLYNVHMDAGHSAGDVRARSEQAAQLLAHIAQRSRGRPVVVAGDTNTHADTEAILEGFRAAEGLVDACRALRCKNPRIIDRVLFRGSDGVALRPVSFTVDPRFVKRGGGDLSDHKAVGVQLEWRLLPTQ